MKDAGVRPDEAATAHPSPAPVDDDGAPTTVRRGVIKLGHQTGNDGTVRCDDVEAASVAGVRLPQGLITPMVEEPRTEPTS